MFRKILIPLDGSPLAEKALAHVQQLAPPGSAELILVNVIETYRYGFVAMDMAYTDVLGYVREGIETYLQQQRSQLEAKQYTVQARILEGDAAQGILEVADATGADLIVMTTHGRAGVARWALGSVAERVIHDAEQPVWLVRDTTRVIPLSEWRRMLVPLDGSAAAEQALVLAQQLAQHTGAELLLLRVVPDLDEANRRILFENESAAQSAFETGQRHAKQYLADVAQGVTNAGIANRTLVVFGEPAHTVLDTANAENVDCIVMATHARLGFERLLHGSVAAEIVRRCGCPLLLVHAHESTESAAAMQQPAVAG